MQSGPIQVIAFAFDRVDRFEGQILRELDELRGHGLIRVIDLRFVMKDVDGTVRTLQEQDMPDGSVRSFGALLDPLLGLTTVGPPDEQPAALETTLSPEQGPGLDLDLLRSAVTDLAPGTAAALVMIEHAWAIGLGTAIVDAGGRMVAQGFLTRDALLAVGRELNAIVEAEVATERAAAIKGAALLDTLTTLAAAEEVQREAMATESSRHAVVILGLRGETDVGSTFLEVLKRYAAALRQQESRLMLVGVDPRVMRQMERTGVLAAIGPAQVFPVEEHVGLALQNALEAAESWTDAQEQAV